MFMGENTMADPSCESDPRFAELCRLLQSKISSTGASNIAALQQLKAARRRYLQHQILLQEIEELSSQPATLCSKETNDVIRKRQQVVRAMQRLSLAAAEKSQSMQGSWEPDVGAQGSTEHVLGVAPAALATAHLKDQHNKQRMAVFTSALDVKLRTRLEHLGSPIAKSNSTSRAWLSQHVAQKVQDVAGQREAVQAAMHQLLQLAAQTLQQLVDTQALLTGFIQENLLDKQQSLDQFNVDLQESYCLSLAGKVGVVELQLQIATYTPENVAALKVLHSHISSAYAAVQKSLERVSSQLNAYQELGPHFKAVVLEYGKVRDELTKAQALLSTFNDLHSEIDHQHG